MMGLRVSPWTAACLLGLCGVAPARSADQAVAPRPAPAITFREAAAKAAAARDRDVGESLRWYREAVRLRPSWDEGWWYLGALSYERGDSTAAARAFARFVELKPDSGPAWALLGLAEFQLRHYDTALRHLTHGLALGTVGNAEIRTEVYYHVAVLRIRAAQYELAMEPLEALARANADSPRLVTACGLALLRLACLPTAVPEDKRELVQLAGGAACAALALQDAAGPRFEELLRRFPSTPNLHYGFGAYLLRRDEGAAAIQQFEREIEVDPAAVYARLEIAYAQLKDGQPARALPYAEQAVTLAPGLFAAHNALGRALFETGQAQRGIAELEQAVKLAPESEHARASLAGAYARAGRPADADRERDVVRKLQAERGTARRSSLAREDALAPAKEEP
jgi:tetratricopeptide (TPR) repeat protein